MATFSSITHIGGAVWKFVPDGTAPFDYYFRGTLVVSQSSADYIYYAHPEAIENEPPALEVVDANDTTLPESTRYPGHVAIQWEQCDAADYYTVERYESGAWVEKARKMEAGAGYYKHVSGTIADGTAEQWRVVAVDADGNSSDAQAFTFTMLGHPEPPNIVLTYSNATHNITVSAAS